MPAETVLESNDIETVARVGDTLGYARVSTHDQNPDAQRAFRAPELPARGSGLGEGVEDGDDLTQRPTEPGEFAHDQAVASMKSSMRQSCLRAYSRMARRWLRRSCCATETLK